MRCSATAALVMPPVAVPACGPPSATMASPLATPARPASPSSQIRRPARTARSASSSCATGAPNTATSVPALSACAVAPKPSTTAHAWRCASASTGRSSSGSSGVASWVSSAHSTVTSLRSSRDGACGARRFRAGWEGRIEQAAMQRLHVGARGRAQLVAQQHPQVVVGAQRLGDVAAPGERRHEQPVAALAKRRGLDRLARGALGVGEPIAAERDAGGRHRLQRAQPQLGDLAAAILRPRRFVAGQEAAAGDLHTAAAALHARLRVAGSERRVGALGGVQRGLEVDPRPGGQHELELAAPAQDVGADGAPHAREQGAERLARIGGQALRPQQLDQLVAPDRAAAVDDEIGEGRRPWRPGRTACRPDSSTPSGPQSRTVVASSAPMGRASQGLCRVSAGSCAQALRAQPQRR